MSTGNPSNLGARLFAAAFAAALIGLAARPALANGLPRREGNIWDWRAHQPTQGAVSAREHAAGVALPPWAQERTAQELGHLDRQLLSRSGGSTSGGGAAVPTAR